VTRVENVTTACHFSTASLYQKALLYFEVQVDSEEVALPFEKANLQKNIL